ncbi:MAG: hypothetical protein AAF267_25595 [Deinococcota bacterium]
MELKVQVIYQADCEHALRSNDQVENALEYLKSRLAGQKIYLRSLSKQGTTTRVHVNGISPFRIVQQACTCGQQQTCDGFSYDGEFFAYLTESIIKDAVLGIAIGQPQQNHNRQTLSCCGSGCADCPY